jgi:hypothetical protein
MLNAANAPRRAPTDGATKNDFDTMMLALGRKVNPFTGL